MKTVLTTFAPIGDRGDVGEPGAVEIVRFGNGEDWVRAFGRVWSARDADEVARRLFAAAMRAAAHNARAMT